MAAEVVKSSLTTCMLKIKGSASLWESKSITSTTFQWCRAQASAPDFYFILLWNYFSMSKSFFGENVWVCLFIMSRHPINTFVLWRDCLGQTCTFILRKCFVSSQLQSLWIKSLSYRLMIVINLQHFYFLASIFSMIVKWNWIIRLYSPAQHRILLSGVKKSHRWVRWLILSPPSPPDWLDTPQPAASGCNSGAPVISLSGGRRSELK